MDALIHFNLMDTFLQKKILCVHYSYLKRCLNYKPAKPAHYFTDGDFEHKSFLNL